MKVTFEKKEEMKAATKNSHLLIGTHSYRTEECKKKTRILQCYRCQRFGHARDSCKARDVRCGKCAGPHRRPECTATASYCANCTGNNNNNNNNGKFLYSAHTMLCALHTYYPWSLDLFIHVPFQLPFWNIQHLQPFRR